jgi:predicted dehydrogenase
MKVAVLSFAHERAVTYARLLHGMPGIDLVVADPDAPFRCQEFGVSSVSSWDEVFALQPEAVVVTSEIGRRRELVEQAAGIGARVLCEQPLATRETDAQAMVDACAAAGVRLTLASPARFSPAFAAVLHAVTGGDVIGRLTTMHGAYNPRPSVTRQPGVSGALGANAPYLLDLVDAALGGEPAEQVYAQANSVLSGQPGVESAALVSVRYSSGVVAVVDCSWGLSADQPGAGGPIMTFVGDRASVEFDACPRLLGGFDVATASERWEAGGANLHAVMLDDFVGGPGNGPDGAAGVRALRVIQAAYESLHIGQPVDLTGCQ